MSKEKTDLKASFGKQFSRLEGLKRYSLVLFAVFIAAIYGFILFRVSSLNSVQPSSDAVAAQVRAAQVPHIDPVVIRQLQSLQDNSVSVQSLFDQARSNPFQ